jgi:hypothetical protein
MFQGLAVERRINGASKSRTTLMKTSLIAILSTGLALSAFAAEPSASTKAKPYTLKTCPVSGETLGGDMGKPYVFEQNGREIKLCCKDCLKDFKKDPAKYIKQIEKAEKKQDSKK